MGKRDFQEDKKWCGKCNDYQPYLMSVNRSYCVSCGSQVRLFSKEDSLRFTDQMQKRRWQGTGS